VTAVTVEGGPVFLRQLLATATGSILTEDGTTSNAADDARVPALPLGQLGRVVRHGRDAGLGFLVTLLLNLGNRT
ncbi:hypothetical protein, partial [Klebsiella oxytoca]|uniref:hypothetical protein n=1 Tax=Klebsiella oxytoca TaxID=571 RepID=UPI0013D8B081